MVNSEEIVERTFYISLLSTMLEMGLTLNPEDFLPLSQENEKRFQEAITDWENLRKNLMGKRTLMVYDRGTCLLVEGLSLEIVDDSSWKKPEEIKKEIREKYQEYRTEKGHEPHFLECAIRWNDTLETLETRIALNMDSDTEMDDEIFFYCDTLDSLLSLADKSGEDFVIAGCFGFGEYKKLFTII